MQNWLPVWTTQTLATQKDSAGKYGRILGQFIVYDINRGENIILNEWMIENYIGVKYHGQSKEDVEAEHLENRKKVNLDVGFMLSEKEEWEF